MYFNKMNCIVCNRTANKKTYKQICRKCSMDSTIVIKEVDVLNLYKLTKEDLRGADLFKIKWCNMRRYLVKDIEKLAYNLTKDLPPLHHKKQAYLSMMKKNHKSTTNMNDRFVFIKSVIRDTLIRNNIQILSPFEYMIKDYLLKNLTDLEIIDIILKQYYETEVDVKFKVYTIDLVIGTLLSKNIETKRDLSKLYDRLYRSHMSQSFIIDKIVYAVMNEKTEENSSSDDSY